MKYFITGTDTNVGKTYITCKLLNHYQSQGKQCLGLKPIASGCEKINGKLRNEDALLLQAASNIKTDYDIINPIRFKEAIAPHIAAKKNNHDLSVKQIIKAIAPGLAVKSDTTLIEGAGGWLTPLNYKETYADLVKALNLPVILVIGIRLGCLNHSLLTVTHIKAMGCELAGWIANCLEPETKEISENILTLEKMITEPRIFRNV